MCGSAAGGGRNIASSHWSTYLAIKPKRSRIWVLREGDHDETTEQTRADRSRATSLLVDATISLARLRAAQGNITGQTALLQEMETSWPETRGIACALRLRKRIAQEGGIIHRQDLDSLSAGLPASLDDSISPALMAPGSWRYQEQLGLVRLQIAYRRQSTAVDLAPTLSFLGLKAKELEGVELAGGLIEVRLLQAFAYEAINDLTGSLQALASALELAEERGFYQTVVEEGAPLRRLLSRAEGRLSNHQLLRQLKAGINSPGTQSGTVDPTDHFDVQSGAKKFELLIEPLSEREQEVLALLSEGLTNAKIAARLFISLPTVKSHAHSIFGKLGVANRRQAVYRGRDLGLLKAR